MAAALTQFALVSWTPLVDLAALNRVAAAIQKQLTAELPRAWGLSASICVVNRVEETPLGAAPIIVVNDIRQAPGTFGFHRVWPNQANRLDDDQPYALVMYEPKDLWSFDASHECLEMVVNPFGNTMIRSLSIEGDREIDYLIEVCDPCGRGPAAYGIDGIVVSDFVTRDYYGPPGPNRPYTAQDRLGFPRTLQRGGCLAWAEKSASAQLGAGEWYMLIEGGQPERIAHPNIYGTLREGVDFQSHEYMLTQSKRGKAELRSFTRALQAEARQLRSKRIVRARSIRQHLKMTRKRSKNTASTKGDS